MVTRLISKEKDEEILFDIGRETVRIEGGGTEIVIDFDEAWPIWCRLMDDGFVEARAKM